MQALALTNLTEIVRRQGRFDEGLEAATRAVGLARSLADTALEAGALAAQGLAEADLERWSDAQVAFEGALTLARRTHQPEIEAVACGGLGQVAFARRRFRRAAAWYRRALRLEAAANDVIHQTESAAALLETMAELKDGTGTEEAGQLLVNLVQEHLGPVPVVLGALEAAGRRWLRRGGQEEAASVFAVAIILAVAPVGEARNADRLAEALARPLASPFILARLEHFSDLDRLHGLITANLNRMTGSSGGPLVDWLSTARAAAESLNLDDVAAEDA